MQSTIFAAIMLLILSIRVASAENEPAVRILFLTDCTSYSDWQSIGMVYSYIYSQHKGPITRVMCCSEEDRVKYPKELLDMVETHIAPAMTVHPVTGDVYAAYNKPEAVIDYMEKVTPPEDWMLVLDSDMIVRMPWHVKDFNLSEGWAVGSRYEYMIGVNNALADRHIPEIPRRNDTFAGPFGRRSDMVGGFFFIHRKDLKRMSKLWLKYTEDVRADPEAYRYSGDQYATKPGQKPWISEMYGYSYGAAKANVWHHWDDDSMMYPGYHPGGIPKVLHYGLEWTVQGYEFDKHWYTNFDPMKCPPWDLSSNHPQEGLFPHPPRPSDLKTKVYLDFYKDLISIEGVSTLNAGLCWWYRKRCPASEQLTRECDKAEQIFFETRESLLKAEAVFDCIDFRTECQRWAKSGECKQNLDYMSYHCRASCNICNPQPYAFYPRIIDILANPKGEKLPEQPVPHGNAGPGSPPAIPAGDALTHSDSLSGSGQKVEVRNPTGNDHPDASPVPVPSPVPSPIPSPSPPPPSPPPPSPPSPPPPSPPSPPPPPPPPPPSPALQPGDTRQDIHVIAGTAHVGGTKNLDDLEAGPPMKLRELLRRCYRMGTLTIEEVKKCVSAAKEGKKWKKHEAPAKRQVTGDDDAATTVKAAAATTTTTATSPATPTPADSVYAPSTVSHLESAFSWQMISVGALLAALVFYALPRALRNHRRARSGMRAE